MKPELVKLMALEGNQERQRAYQVAQSIRNADELLRLLAQAKEDSPQHRQLFEWWESTWCMIGLHVSTASNLSRFVDLVASAIKDGESWEPKTFRRRQIEAWSAAYHLAARTGTGFKVFAWPTLKQVKDQFKKLFPKVEPLADMTFRRTFKELGLRLAKKRTGRPKGSRDSEKRTRRKNWLKKRRP